MGLYLTIALLVFIAAVILRAPFHRVKSERKHDILFDALDLLAQQYAAHRDIHFHVDLGSHLHQRYFHELVAYHLITGDSNSISITSKGIKAVLAASNIYLMIGKWTKSISFSTVIVSILYFLLTAIVMIIPSIAIIYALSLDGWTVYVECATGAVILFLSLMSAHASMRLYALNNNADYKQYLITLRMSEAQLRNN